MANRYIAGVTEQTADAVRLVAMIDMEAGAASSIGSVATTDRTQSFLSLQQLCIGAVRKPIFFLNIIICTAIFVISLPFFTRSINYFRVIRAALTSLIVVFFCVFDSLNMLKFARAFLAVRIKPVYMTSPIPVKFRNRFSSAAARTRFHRACLTRSYWLWQPAR